MNDFIQGVTMVVCMGTQVAVGVESWLGAACRTRLCCLMYLGQPDLESFRWTVVALEESC